MLAKEMRFIERFKAQAAKAAQVQSRVKQLDKIEKVEPPKRRSALSFDFPPCPRSGDDVVRIEGLRKGYGAKRHLRRLRPHDPPRRALGGDGRERRRQVDAAAAGRRRERARRAARSRSAPTCASATSPSTRWRCSKPERSVLADAGGRVPAGQRRHAAHAGRLLRLPRRRHRTSPAACCPAARRRASCSPGCSTTGPNFLVLDEPTNHLDMATKDMLVRALASYEGTMLFVSHDRRFLADALESRARTRGPTAPSSTAAATASTSRPAATRRPACAEFRAPAAGP